MAFARSNSFMSDGDDLGLGGEDFFGDDDGGDLGKIFDVDHDEDVPIDESKDSLDLQKAEEENDDPKKSEVENSNNGDDNQRDNGSEKPSDDNEEKAKKKENEEIEGGDNDGDEENSKKKKRRRSGTSVGEPSGPPPAWHNEEADKPHRESMIKEISQLLQARKKTAPTKEWMKQLPHKARVLEDRLYRKASSLEAYLNRSTLKNRLRTLAVTITAHYKTSGKSRKKTKRTSTGSVHSTEGEADRRDSASSNAVSLSQVNSLDAQLLSSDGHNAEAGNDSGQLNLMPDGDEDGDLSVTSLARQKQVNEDLQHQIMANIRQQQQLVHNIRRGSNEMPNANGSRRGSLRANGMESPAEAMSGQFNNMQNPNQMQTAMQGKNMQGVPFPNNQGDSMMHRGAASSQSMGNNAFDAQTNMMRRTSAPGVPNGGGHMNGMNTNMTPQQMMMMQQQGGMNMNMQNMQATMMRRNSSAGNPNNQAQFQAQQAAMMRQNPNAQVQNQMAQAQMQAAMMRQASAGNNQFNNMHAQAALMRGNQMDPQTQAALMNQMNSQMGGPQAALMRQGSGAGPGGHMMGNPAMMGQHMGNNGNNMGRMPNGQMMPGFGGNQQMMMQGNPAMMQGMNMAGMQGMGQFPGMQQQMGMAAVNGRNSMMMMGNDGNPMENMNFQGKKGGDDMGMPQNSFGW